MGVISYASTAPAPAQEAVSTFIPSTTTTATATTSTTITEAATSSLPSTDQNSEEADFTPAYIVVLCIPAIFCLIAFACCVLESLDRRRKARRAAQGTEDIELRALERHWFPWREALDDDEVRTASSTRPRYQRAPPLPRPDRRTRRERKADEAAAAAAKETKNGGETAANPGDSSTLSTDATAGSKSQLPTAKKDTKSQTGGRGKTSKLDQAAPPAEEEWPKMNNPCRSGPAHAGFPPSGPPVADLEGVFVVGCESDEENDTRPGRPDGQAHHLG